MYYTSNGGKIVQSTRTVSDVELGWVTDMGLVIVSAAPRVAPEYPHPAQVEDAYAGLV